MSGGHSSLSMADKDIMNLLACACHLGDTHLNFQMKPYVYKRRSDGIHIFSINKMWEKLLLAARAIVAIEDPRNVSVICSRPIGQRAILKFATYTGATAFAGRFTPGTFTNQIQKSYTEPRLLVVTDPRNDHQAICEASFANIPVVAFCDTDTPLRFVDIAIPCNNKGGNAIGLMWWMLAREVLRLRGLESRTLQWHVLPDLFFYRDPEDQKKEEAELKAKQEEQLKQKVDDTPKIDYFDMTSQPTLTNQTSDAVDQPAQITKSLDIVQDWGSTATDWTVEQPDWATEAKFTWD